MRDALAYCARREHLRRTVRIALVVGVVLPDGQSERSSSPAGGCRQRHDWAGRTHARRRLRSQPITEPRA
jgi:hypothetical protein